MVDRSNKAEATLEKIKAKIQEQHDEMSKEQRFGYFSLIYPQTVGDEAYSGDKNEMHQIVEGKVVTDKRGIFTQPGKKGKGRDVYFAEVEPISKEEFEKMRSSTNEARDKYIQQVKEKKEEKPEIMFKPCGPQEYRDYFDQNPKVYDIPITKPRKLNVTIVEGQVITEKRGIMTNPTKLGSANVPGVLFSYPPYVIPEPENKKTGDAKDDKKSYKKPFAPASLSKNECFASIKETFGGDDSQFKNLLNEYKSIQKKGRSKYEKVLPKGSTKHNQPFSPPKLISTGRETLFNDDLYKLPPIEEKKISASEVIKMRKETEQKKNRPAFTYNKIMKHSTFSPSITSFSCNLKREFPSISFH